MSKRMETHSEKAEVEKPTDVPFDFDTFELKTVEDYATWNLHAHRAFREAKKSNPKCDPPVPVRVPDESFHKKVKVKFQRFVYDLPLPVVKFLNRLATPIFAEVRVENGGDTKTETRQVGERNRFSCHLLELA
jgi:hypothetical protein